MQKIRKREARRLYSNYLEAMNVFGRPPKNIEGWAELNEYEIVEGEDNE